MLGAITGDIIGSLWEFRRIKTKEFPLFLEDSRFTLVREKPGRLGKG